MKNIYLMLLLTIYQQLICLLICLLHVTLHKKLFFKQLTYLHNV